MFWKRELFLAQTSFHYGNQYGFIRSVEDFMLRTESTIDCVMSGRCIAIQVTWEMVRPCDRNIAWCMFGIWQMYCHLMSLCVAPIRLIEVHPHAYLVIWWHIIWALCTPWKTCGVSNSTVDYWVLDYWVLSGLFEFEPWCFKRPHAICGTTGTPLCFCWGMDHWPLCTWPPWCSL